MLVYILGSGAMGCRLGYQIQEFTDGHEVILLDQWQEHIDQINEQGLKIEGDRDDTAQMTIMKPEEASRPADLIIVLTKSMQLKSMMQAVDQIITKDTQLLCLLNGLGHLETLKTFLPEEQIHLGVTTWTAALNGPGVAHLEGSSGEIALQGLHKENQATSHDIVDMLNEARLHAHYDEDVQKAIWRKACLNGTMNSNCAILDCTMGEFSATNEFQTIIRRIIHEFVTVARAEGIELNEGDIVERVERIGQEAGHHYPSMHQDLVQNHRLTEIDYLNGAIARKGAELGLETTYCDYITQLIHAKEAILGAK